VSITWSRALAWRLRQHLLDPIGTEPVAEVVRRLGAVPATPEESAELAIRLRRQQSHAGEVARAVAEGRLIKTFAFRGAVHLMTPQDGAAYLALRAASRMWELPSWQSFYGVAPADWELLRATVREALADGPLTRDELGAAVTAQPKFRHLGFAFADNGKTFLKPLCWQGVMSFGPSRDGRTTFQGLDQITGWTGLLELEQAGMHAVESYFRAYGPATVNHLRYWLAEGLGAGRKRVQSWIAGVEGRLSQINVDGENAYVLRDDLEALQATRPTKAVRLLPGFDQWVMGPGTADVHVVPPARRRLVTRQAALVVAGGVVSGTWALADNRLIVDWFPEAGAQPQRPLAEEAARLGTILERRLQLEVNVQALRG
jgi:hypothetical protein